MIQKTKQKTQCKWSQNLKEKFKYKWYTKQNYDLVSHVNNAKNLWNTLKVATAILDQLYNFRQIYDFSINSIF